MSTRTAVTSAVASTVALSALGTAHLFEVVFDDETVRATDAYTDITWDGNTYTASGDFLSFSGIDETADLQVNAVRVSLSGIDQEWISLVLSKKYIDRRLKIWKVVFTSAMVQVDDPIPIFDGRIDAPAIEEDPESGKSVVTISAASLWVDFERKPGRHTNHSEQQIWFPGDKGFEYVSQVNKQAIWGRK